MRGKVAAVVLLIAGAAWYFWPQSNAIVYEVPVQNYDVILAFTSKTCGKCVQDKQVLAQLSDHYWIVTVDATSFGIPVPHYEVYVNGVWEFQTNNVLEIQ